MKTLLIALCVACGCVSLHAQTSQWQPTPGHTQVPIWPGTAPDAQPVRGPEVTSSSGPADLIGGKPVIGINNVIRPTLTVYSPHGNNTGVAVVVFPGGGYQMLAIDLEGTEVCDWLTAKGITCVLLKYRVTDMAPYPKSGPYPESPMALEDAQWHIDPHKVGVLGFSAGGHLVAAISTHYAHRLYAPVDVADQQSCRPDFAVALYPGHLSMDAAEWDAKQGSKPYPLPQAAHLSRFDSALTLSPFVPVTAQTPPTFLLQAENDHEDSADDSLAYYIALRHAGVPTEMHLYAEGGHAFGLRPTKYPITRWPQLVETWLHTIGMLPQ